MSKVATKMIPVESLQPGMEVEFLGRFHRIIRVDEYEGPFTELGAFAIMRWVGYRGHESGMTMFKGDLITVAA